jgi:hypothetical protein
MTSGKQTLKNRKSVQGYIESEEREAFDEIRWREHKTESELLREAVQEYIRLHSEGNDTFKLDDWNLNPLKQAIPNMFAEDSKIKEDYLSSSKEERNNRFKNAQRILQIYKNINYEESK